MSQNYPGFMISGAGIDGCGKTSALSVCAQRLESKGFQVVRTREPGGTPLGEKLRHLLLTEKMNPETEALLMFASRRELFDQIIEPALAGGACVVSDRFTDCSFAFQCGGRGIDRSKLETLERWVLPLFQPDLTILFDTPTEIAHARMATGRTLDRFELEKADFHKNVRAEYLRRAAEFPDRFRIVDATKSVAEVNLAVELIVDEFLERKASLRSKSALAPRTA